MVGFRSKNSKNKKLEAVYVAVFCRNINDVPTYVNEQLIEKDAKTIVYNGKDVEKSLTWIINELTPAFRDNKGRFLIYCDMDKNGAFLDFKKHEMPLNIKTMDALVTQNIVVGFLKLIKNAFNKEEKNTGKIVIFAIGAVVGGLAGYIIRETTGQMPQMILTLQHLIG